MHHRGGVGVNKHWGGGGGIMTPEYGVWQPNGVTRVRLTGMGSSIRVLM